MAQAPRSSEVAQRLALVRQLWGELFDARKDPLKYRSLSERIRKEADRVRQLENSLEPES